MAGDRRRSKEGLTIIKNILKNRKGKVSLENLRADLQDILDKGDIKTFRELSGLSLDTFLRQHSEIFFVPEDGSYVSLRESSDPQEPSTEECLTDTELLKGAVGGKKYPESSDMLICADVKDLGNKEVKDSGSERESNDSSQETSWQKVRTKKQKRNKESTRCLLREVARKKNEDDDVTKLKHLLSKPESESLKFVADHNVYAKNPLQCQLDIVCMWNTPQQISSHIVIGVESRPDNTLVEHVSNEPDFNIDFYLRENLFRENIFTTVPEYKFKTVKYKSREYGIIEIGSSWSHSHPAVVQRVVEKGNVILSENELWYRKGHENVICHPKDSKISMIYQWFLGNNSCNVDVKSNTLQNISSQGNERFDKQTEGDTRSSLATSEDSEAQFRTFCEEVNDFKKGHFILLSGNVSNKIRNLSHFALIPYLAVYDFDVFSCTDGLFNAVQDSLEKHRQLQIGTWKEQPPCLSENSTYWCFVRGRREFADSRTDTLDGVVEDPMEWFRLVKDGMLENFHQISTFVDEYTVLTVILLWPSDVNLAPMMRKFLDRLTENLTQSPKVVICMHNAESSETERAQLHTLLSDYKSAHIHVCKLDFSQLCLGIASKISRDDSTTLQYTLPTASNSLFKGKIQNKDALWLKEDIEVLYLKSTYPKPEEDVLNDENLKFYKGGTLNWFAWYENDDNNVDITRDLLKDAEAIIEKNVDVYKPVILTLLHAPGSGGTTLAHRILWNFHTRIPCVHAKSGTILRSADLARKISFIHEITQLPVLLLVDGEDDTKVKYLCSGLKHTIILHVKRYPFSMKHVAQGKPPKKDKYKMYLKGTVSANEAKMLATKFGERCDASQRRKLVKMKTDVEKKKSAHNMYEFGMTVFQHEFKGIVSYVRGYLQLPKDPKVPLQPWQLCLGYLSLVYFYGQTSVPCQFFSKLYGKQSNYVMSLDEDFGHPATEFIVHDTNDRRKQTIRMCHYEVAKEILEQILSRGHNTADSRTERLGKIACRNIGRFAINFIEYCSGKTSRGNAHLSQAVRHILTKTFIYREEIDMGEFVETKRKRPQLSQLLLDIPSGKPLFAERLEILETLSDSFPKEPNFHAHVGRFYAFCGPEDEKKAEACFKRAIHLCEDKSKGNSCLDDSSKNTLAHVYHMYGVLKMRKIIRAIEGTHTTKSIVADSMDTFFVEIKELVDIGEEACGYLYKCRELTAGGFDIFTDAYLCEIKVRLQICDYVMRQFKPKSEETTVFSDFFDSMADDSCKWFVEDSILKIEHLLIECTHDVEMDPGEQSQLRKHVKWFNALFKRQNIPEWSLVTDDDIKKTRRLITSLKLDHIMDEQSTDIRLVINSDALHEIIRLYEEIFRTIHAGRTEENISKKDVDSDYREWILAIRHDMCQRYYTLEDILHHVIKWHQYVRSPMSTFYLFVIKSILGFGTDTIPGNTEYLIDALELRKGLSKNSSLVIRPKFPREWLGVSDGIKIIQPGARKHDAKDSGKTPGAELRVCKGTIMHPNIKAYSGQISYDVKVRTINVFFIPCKTSLDGTRYAGHRVEFKLAFTMENGYEAFEVHLLKRHGCRNCSAMVEFTSTDTCLPCTNCSELIFKDPMNEIKNDDDIETVSE